MTEQTLSITERLRRMRAAPAMVQAEQDAALDELALAEAAPVAPSRSYAEVTGKKERPAPPRIAPRAAESVFDRLAKVSARPPVPQAAAVESRLLAWDDPTRPAGSAFSREEWEATRAESAFARPIVFELHKAAERGLVVLDASNLAAVHAMFLEQALLIDERLGAHEAWHNASARLEHVGQDTVRWTYRVVHAAEAHERVLGLRGARLRTGGAVDQAAEPTPAPRGG